MAILSSARITKANRRRQAHANLYNIINNRTNIPDPNDSTGNRKFVHVREPHFSADNFPGFPCIEVPRFTTSSKSRSVDRTKSEVVLKTTIKVYTQDNTSDSVGNASGAEQDDIITDYILKTLDSSSIRATLRGFGMAPFEIVETTSEVGEVDGKAVFITEIPVMFAPHLVTG